MCTARIAALSALSRPTVATGTPGGIWTMERMLSRPSPRPSSGTPMTGFSVRAATVPGSAAESPAIATKTSTEGSCVRRSTFSGLRWAEATWTSQGTSNSARRARTFSAVSRSDLLPTSTATFMGSSPPAPGLKVRSAP
jgi:hypothetical protein